MVAHRFVLKLAPFNHRPQKATNRAFLSRNPKPLSTSDILSDIAQAKSAIGGKPKKADERAALSGLAESDKGLGKG